MNQSDLEYLTIDEDPFSALFLPNFTELVEKNDHNVSSFDITNDSWNASDQCGNFCTLLVNETLIVPVVEEYSFIFLLLSLLVFAGGLGNILVCLAICLESRLHNVTNYFLMSLAVADLLVCVTVMPFGIVEETFGYWPFGEYVCNAWITSDVLSCSSSIIHMCFISLRRYFGIHNPLKVRTKSKKSVFLQIVLVWVMSMLISSPITVLGIMDTRNIQPEPDSCAINNRFFFVFGSLFAFYIPMIIMITTYVLTVRLLRQKAQSCRQKSMYRMPFTKNSLHRSTSQPYSSRGHSPVRNGCSTVERGSSTQSEPESSCNKSGSFSFKSRRSNNDDNNMDCNKENSINAESKYLGSMIRTMGTSQVKNEQKATKVLGIVFFTFVICWAPFFVLNILFAVVGPESFPEFLASTFLWLGYVSSTINPIIYTIFNRTFRNAFVKLLMCQCHFSPHRRRNGDTVSWSFQSQHTIRRRQHTCRYTDSEC